VVAIERLRAVVPLDRLPRPEKAESEDRAFKYRAPSRRLVVITQALHHSPRTKPTESGGKLLVHLPSWHPICRG
jgi:hypothetical protein